MLKHVRETPPLWDTTEKIISAFRAAYNKLDIGFLEQVYIRALEIECRKRDLRTRREARVIVKYDDIDIGYYRVDLLVDAAIIVEVKTGARSSAHYRQMLNYLRCSHLYVGLLLYFSDKPDWRRVTMAKRT